MGISSRPTTTAALQTAFMLCSIFWSIIPVKAQNELFISEYLETTSNKCIEIFNPTNSPITFNGTYRLRIAYNGNSSATTVRNMVGVIQPKSTFVLCKSGSSFGADDYWGVAGHNGNDAVVLEKNGNPIDIIGNIGCDPGMAWTSGSHSTKNKTLLRKSCIDQGISNDPGGNCPFPTLTTEWVALSAGTSHLGNHDFLSGIDAVTSIPPSDCGLDDAVITISASGSGLEYSIDGGMAFQLSNTFLDLPSGNYSIVVRSALDPSCQQTATTQIEDVIPPEITAVTTQDPSDCMVVDGSIEITATGADLQYSIDNGQSFDSDPSFTNLPAGSYQVLVRRSGTDHCLDSKPPVMLTDPDPPVISLHSSQDISCKGWTNGFIKVTASAGSGLYNYVWTGPIAIGNVSEQSDLPPGTYQVEVFDGNNQQCRDTLFDIQLFEPNNEPPLPALDPLPDVCSLDNPLPLPPQQDGWDGTWTGPGVNHPFFDPSGLAGDQVLTFTPDPGQCANPAQSTISVTQPTSLSLPDLDPLCENDGPIDLLSNHQGIAGIWSGPGVNHPFFDPSGLAGDQVLTFTPDPGQCADPAQSTISVTQPTSVSLPDLDPLCQNDDPIDLLSNHQGIAGIWTGPGVSHPFFDPSGLAGDQVLTFTPDPGQCADPAQSTISVTQPTSLSLPDLDPLCQNDDPIDLLSNHQGIAGIWSWSRSQPPIF